MLKIIIILTSIVITDNKIFARVDIFIDELNKYASKETPKNLPVLCQVLDVAERGRFLGVVLFAAKQFRSKIHDHVTGSCSTAYGRTRACKTNNKLYNKVYNERLV